MTALAIMSAFTEMALRVTVAAKLSGPVYAFVVTDADTEGTEPSRV
jgi:hypothetical protein